LSYGEVLFGAYSEQTLLGLVTVGEILEKVGTDSAKNQASHLTLENNDFQCTLQMSNITIYRLWNFIRGL
jgi:hypothetical protein